ncbi:MAG: VOC family protein [Thermoleophilaceae bacterium]|nr:VOC family protein [Thermoleophilaceae bacterium]
MTESTGFIKGVDFVYVFTEDLAKAEDFYGGTLELPELKRYGQMPGVEYQAGNLTLAVIQSEAFGVDFAKSSQSIAFQVDDVAAARAKLEAAGVKFVADTIDSGVCHMAFFNDPDGNSLMFHHRYAPKDARPGE